MRLRSELCLLERMVVWLLVRTRNDAMAGERLAKAGPHAVSGAPSRDENGGALGEEAEREHGTVSPVKFPDCRLKEGHEHDILFRWIEGGRRTEGERRDHSSPSSPPRACANPARGGGHRPRPRSSSEAGSSQRRRWLRGKAAQFNSQSLNRHIARTYNFGDGVGFSGGSVEVLAATQTAGESGKKWFQGTADAVRQFLWLFEDARLKCIENILILSGDHLYRMDYMDFVQKHVDSGADISVACVPMDESRASDFGLMKADRNGCITDFLEKPKGESLKSMQVDMDLFGLSPEFADTYKYMASMGIYVFKADVLRKLLRGNYPTANDFGSEVIPMAAKDYDVQAYLFNGYWEDIGTIKSFFEANLALTDQTPNFYFYDPVKPIFTSPRFLPPTRVENCKVLNSIVSHGCFLTECSVEHSVIGIRSRLEKGVQLKDTMMMGADYYQTEAERCSELSDGKVPVGVGENTIIRKCIIDKNARIGKNVVIMNSDNVQEADRPAEGFYIRSGITVVLKNAVIPDGTTI